MREGASSEVKYTVQSGGKTVKSNYDNLDYHKRQTRLFNRQIRREKNEGIERSFISILWIVLFMLFTTTISQLPEPSNVTNIESNTNYIREIAPTVGESSITAIASFFSFAEGLARIVETLVTSFGTIANSIVSFFSPNWLTIENQSTEIGQVCIAYEDLNFVRRAYVASSYAVYRLLISDGNFGSVEAFWNDWQLRDYGLVCS